VSFTVPKPIPLPIPIAPWGSLDIWVIAQGFMKDGKANRTSGRGCGQITITHTDPAKLKSFHHHLVQNKEARIRQSEEFGIPTGRHDQLAKREIQ
jgi:hypothetical protein